MRIRIDSNRESARTLSFHLIIIGLLLASAPMLAQQWPEPRQEAKAGARWWWLGSAVDKENLQWNMAQYASHGIGALEITPLYGVQGNDANNIPFLSDKWMEMLRFTQAEGKKNGIEIDMNMGTGWPFGGPEVPLEEAACKVVFVDTLITSASQLESFVLQAPEKERPYAKLKEVMAFRKPKMNAKNQFISEPVQCITEDLADGRIIGRFSQWMKKQLKSEDWRVIAVYESRTRQKVKRAAPGGEGYVIDHFDSTAVAHYLQKFEQAFKKTNTPYPHTFFNDSYEVYGADWTPTLPEEFEKRRGYNLMMSLEAFIDGDAQVVSDYRETLGELLLENFTNQWVTWCHQRGVKVRNQAHGSPANLIDVYAAVDIPEIEGFGLSDFGIKGLRTDPGKTRKNDSDLSMLKYAASAAHVTGKPFTSSETFTWLTEHFRTSLSQMKPDMDLMFCSGVNHMYFHGTCYSPKDDPWPGWKFYASIDMSPTNSIWRDASYFMKYVERCQSFLQWGQPDNDFLVYLPVRDMWRNDTKKRLMQFAIHDMGKKAPDFIRDVLAIDRAGFDCDYISERLLKGVKSVDIKGAGKMLKTADGTLYKSLVIPDGCTLSDDVRNHIENLRSQGVHVVNGTNANELGGGFAKPEPMKTSLGLNLIRRKNETGYHYFVANLTPNDVDAWTTLAVDFSKAVWYNPLNGEVFAAQQENNKVRVSLRSGESMILRTYNNGTEGAVTVAAKAETTESLLRTLDSGWTLRFIESTPTIEQSYTLEKLQSWENLDAQTRTLMGTGVYETSFKLTKKELKNASGWKLDLGDVRESARVFVNGTEIGCAWSVPYTLSFDASILKKGDNTIRIEVTNLPANRIAQLDRDGVKWRKMNEINVVDINYKKTLYDQWELVPSGLNSAVKLYRLDKVAAKK